MTMWFSFSDSEVHTLHAQGDACIVSFSAACVQTPSAHGWGWAQGHARLALVCHGAAPAVLEGHCAGRLREGRLVAGATSSARVALPCQVAGPVTLELHFANGAVCSVACQAVSLPAPPEDEVRESLMC